jgi:hypothetical protein
MYTRHPYKKFLWKELWPTFLRNNLSDRLHVNTSGAHWAQDKYRKILTRALQLFNRLRHKVALQIAVHLNHLPDLHAQHIPRIPHASRARLPQRAGDSAGRSPDSSVADGTQNHREHGQYAMASAQTAGTRGQTELSVMADASTGGRTDHTKSSRGQMELFSQPSDV